MTSAIPPLVDHPSTSSLGRPWLANPICPLPAPCNSSLPLRSPQPLFPLSYHFLSPHATPLGSHLLSPSSSLHLSPPSSPPCLEPLPVKLPVCPHALLPDSMETLVCPTSLL
ncbi:hypothetical protein AMTRI_Chr02g259620 [Amborella trichopoda]